MLCDEDGVDGPFNRAMKRAMRDDARLREMGLKRLPTASRSSVGMETRCYRCGEEITDETFCAGFPNRTLHERCALRRGGSE